MASKLEILKMLEAGEITPNEAEALLEALEEEEAEDMGDIGDNGDVSGAINGKVYGTINGSVG